MMVFIRKGRNNVCSYDFTNEQTVHAFLDVIRVVYWKDTVVSEGCTASLC